VDDGSTDKSGNLCEEYAKFDERVNVIHKKNGGLSDARNAGISVANGKYITFVDSDDYIDFNMIYLMYQRIIKDNTDMCMCNFCRVDEEGNLLYEEYNSLIKNKVLEKNQIFSEFTGLTHSKYVVACCKLYKKEIFNECRYIKGKTHEDEFIVHHILDRCNKISCMEDRLYYYLKRANSIMNSGFSIKRMDAVEAILERTQFAIEKDINILTEASFINAFEILVQGYINLDFNDEKVKKRMNELKQYFDRLYPEAKKTIKSHIRKSLIFLFRINPKIYINLYKLKKEVLK
jgi:glycosyltransferase involved in cell wall biosynthesis